MSHDLTRHHQTPSDDSIWVGGRPEPEVIAIAAYDPSWPALFEKLAARVKTALGAKALGVEHVGSTSVPGLAVEAGHRHRIDRGRPGRRVGVPAARAAAAIKP
jgi:hypothetical protein